MWTSEFAKRKKRQIKSQILTIYTTTCSCKIVLLTSIEDTEVKNNTYASRGDALILFSKSITVK